MNNKKGFTLVEITISIVLLLLLAALVLPNLVDTGDKTKESMYNSKIDLALSGAYKYGVDNIDKLSSECKEVTIGALINMDYIDGDDEGGYNLINPLSGESMNSIILCVYYDDNEVKTRVK